MLRQLTDKVLGGGQLNRDEALMLTALHGPELFALFAQATRIRHRYRGQKVSLCAITSAKTGACPEDCAYCAQSSRSTAPLTPHPLIDSQTLGDQLRRARPMGVSRYSIVTGGRKVNVQELTEVARMMGTITSRGMAACASLGFLDRDELMLLKDAGMTRYHHNLESSRRHFPAICSTHTYDEKIATARMVRELGISLCSGGIFGMGETWADRVDMALDLRVLGADSIPINFLVPIPGTPLERQPPLRALEALQIISVYRFILPNREIRIAGGRLQTLGQLNSFVFMAGADSLISGDMLTTMGQSPMDDLDLIRQYGLTL